MVATWVVIAFLLMITVSSLFGSRLEAYNSRPRVIKKVVTKPICSFCTKIINGPDFSKWLPEKYSEHLYIAKVQEVPLTVKDGIGSCSRCGFEARVLEIVQC